MTNILPIQSKDGHIYWVEEGDTLYIQRLQAGQYQKSNWVFARTLIQDWRRCIDIGSNNACNAIHYSKQFDTVECFEPTQLAISLWTNTIRDNKVTNCNLHTDALGEQNKTTEIILHAKNGGHNHLSNSDRPQWSGKEWRTRISKTRSRQLQQVQVRTLDSYQFSDVDFIKIDVEGYEKFVLEGAQQTIQNNRPILQLEIVANQCRKFGYWGEDMIDWIRSWDYVVVSRRRGRLDGVFKSHQSELRYEGVKYKGEMDLWFVPKEKYQTTQFEQLFEQIG
jgi:FkbM family methyltransferase